MLLTVRYYSSTVGMVHMVWHRGVHRSQGKVSLMVSALIVFHAVVDLIRHLRYLYNACSIHHVLLRLLHFAD